MNDFNEGMGMGHGMATDVANRIAKHECAPTCSWWIGLLKREEFYQRLHVEEDRIRRKPSFGREEKG